MNPLRTAIENTAVNSEPGMTRRRPMPLRSAFVGAVIGSIACEAPLPAGHDAVVV
jgi:hypothetical protein